MRLMVILLLLGSLIMGCESEEQKQAALEKQRAIEQAALEEKRAKDAINACAEIGQTTRGFSGPSQRMQILKSYGWEPSQAAGLEAIFNVRFEFAEPTKNICEYGGFETKCDCLRRGMAMLSCEIGYIAILSGTKNTVLEEATKVFEQC